MLCRRVLHLNKIYLSDVHLHAYTITYSEYFIYNWSTRLQSMYNHIVGRTASVISPFYSLLPDMYLLIKKLSYSVSEIRDLQRSINTYNMRYFSQHVLLCKSTVHHQSGDICIQGYLRILWIGNAKSLKIDNIHKRYVLCLKLKYFFIKL